MSMQSDVVPRSQLYDIASSVFAQKLAQVPGVGQVQVFGSSLPAVRVELNPQPVSDYNVGMDEIGSFLAAANANTANGELSTKDMTIPLSTTDQLALSEEGLQESDCGLPEQQRRYGCPISGTFSIRWKTCANIGIADGKPAILMAVSRQPNANIIETVDNVKALLPQFEASLPPTIHLSVDNDRTGTIRASVKEAQITMGISMSLVVVVVFVFLRNGWATLIPSISVPVSLIGTFAAMYLLGYTLDNLSLMALTIATGFVVDDAIVVIENITRYIEQGVDPMTAALKGAQEIGFTVLSMSVSLIAVFIPILMMGGIVGRLFREFAVVLSVAIFVSMIVSLTVTPMMCSRLLKVEHNHGRMYRWSESVFQWIIDTYGSALRVVLNHPALTMLVMALTIGVNVCIFTSKFRRGFSRSRIPAACRDRSRASSISRLRRYRRRFSISKSRSEAIRRSERLTPRRVPAGAAETPACSFWNSSRSKNAKRAPTK